MGKDIAKHLQAKRNCNSFPMWDSVLSLRKKKKKMVDFL